MLAAGYGVQLPQSGTHATNVSTNSALRKRDSIRRSMDGIRSSSSLSGVGNSLLAKSPDKSVDPYQQVQKRAFRANRLSVDKIDLNEQAMLKLD